MVCNYLGSDRYSILLTYFRHLHKKCEFSNAVKSTQLALGEPDTLKLYTLEACAFRSTAFHLDHLSEDIRLRSKFRSIKIGQSCSSRGEATCDGPEIYTWGHAHTFILICSSSEFACSC